MYKKLIYLVSFLLVLGLVPNASAWTGVDIGDDPAIGSQTYDAATGTWTVKGDGHDIWDNADDFHYIYKYLQGDGTLTARVVSISGPGTSTWGKAGVMMRETLADTSRHAMMVVTSGDGGGSNFQWRMTTGGSSSNDGDGPGLSPPLWVRMVRAGDAFSGYYSQNGTTWTQLGTAQTIDMKGRGGTYVGCYIGLCLTSHESGILRQAVIDNVSYTGNVTDKAPPVLMATAPNPADGATGVTMGLLQWTAGETAVWHDVYFGTNPTPGAAEFKGRVTYAVFWGGTVTPGTTYYWRIDEIEADGTTIHTGNVWSFTAQPLTAWNPKPANGATSVFPAAQLSWGAGVGATKHHLYFGDIAADVDSGTGGTDKGILAATVTTYNPGLLYPETTYYWRVDESPDNGATWRKGDTWSFTTAAGGTGVMREWWLNIGAGTAVSDLTSNANYPDNPTGREVLNIFEGPTDWADNYGSRLYGWLMPPESGDYTFWIATDDYGQLWLSTDADPANKQMIANVPGWVPSRDFDNTGGGVGGDSQKSAAISLVQGQKYYIEALMKEGGGGDNIAVAWQGPGISARQVIAGNYVTLAPFAPVRAYGPTPANGATGVTDTPTLRWLAGEKAAKHDVYFGTDATAVANATTTSTGIYRGQQSLDATSYAPTEVPLLWSKAYYWRIDEINTGVTGSPWKGNVWSFTTANYILVDNFEDYTDDVGSRIFQTWKDGWGYSQPPPGYAGNGTGSAVGNSTAPYAEQTIVHLGGQSLSLGYDNSGTSGKARYSETFREWPSTQNWTRNDVKALTLWLYGALANDAVQLYVALEDNAGHIKVVNHPDPETVQKTGWREWNIPLSDFSGAGVNLAAIKKMYIGLGNRTSPTAGGTGKIYIDDIRVYPSRPIGKPAADLSGNYIVDAADVDILANLWLDTGFQVTPADPGTTALIARYPFDGNANDVVGGHNGTVTGAPTYAVGQIGQAIQLNGVDQYVDVGPVGISGAAARTISGWAKSNALVDALTDWINIFGFTGPSGANGHFDIEMVNVSNNRGYGIHVYGWERNIMPIDFDWHHLAASYDGTTLKWYGDGRLIGSDSTRVLDTPDNVHMGKRDDNENYWPGRVDEVRIYNRVLTDAQIAWLAGLTTTFSIPADLRQDNVIDFKDFAVLADSWLEELRWP